jgi:Arc/MetJ family transcription regulator
MKTTIDIADPLLAEAKRIAARKHTTVRALVEDGLRRVLDDAERDSEPFVLRDGRFRGRGMKPEFERNWEAIRDVIHEGRGA